MYISQIFVQKTWMNFLLNTSTIFFLDLNDCFALTEISSLKNTQMIGICWFRSSPSYSIENCKTHCLYDSRCVGVNPTGHCIEYMYQAVTSRCHFPRTAIHFIHKGNHIVSYLIKFLFNVSNHAPVRKDAWRYFIWAYYI